MTSPGISIVTAAIGGATEVTLDPTGRNRVALEGELAALADLGTLVHLDDRPGWDLGPIGIVTLAERLGVRIGRRPRDSSTGSSPLPAAAGCPKAMTFGPCGGVDPDGGCELGEGRCAFLAGPLPRPAPADLGLLPALTPAAREVAAIMGRRPLIVAATPAAPMSRRSIEECADLMRDTVDLQLAGDAGISRTQFPPAYRTWLMARAGVRTWNGMPCRDRDAAALEVELASLHRVGSAGVHCVTGDHPALGTRDDARGVFELEGTTLIPRARTAGLMVSFPETPSAPPVDLRVRRAAGKVAVGGQWCLPQYVGEVDETADFIAALHGEVGATVPVLPGIPLILDRAGAELMASFRTARLPRGYAERVLAAADPFIEGIRAAVDLGTELLGIDGVAGVVIAGGIAPGAEPELAGALARVSAELGGGAG